MKKLTCSLLLASIFILSSCNNKLKEVLNTDSKPGINLNYMDSSIKPGDDFFKYVNGKWIDSTKIPDDKSVWGSFNELAKNTDHNVLKLINDAANNKTLDPKSDEGKAISLYKSILDTITRSNLGIKVLEKDLQTISQIKSINDVNNYIKKEALNGSTGLIGAYISADSKDSNKNVVYAYGASKGLPDRDYYLINDDENSKIRTAYIAHISRMLQAIGQESNTANKNAKIILDFETNLAKQELTRSELRDDNVVYNPLTLNELKDLAPTIDWEGYFNALGLKNIDKIIVGQPKTLKNLSTLLATMPIENVKAFLNWNLINNAAAYLSPELEKANWDFYAKTLYGAQKQESIDERAINIINDNIGEALGKLYVDKYFPAEAKQKAKEMIDNVIKAYENRINNLPWMTPATRKGALEKLHNLTIKIGYPDKWEDFSKLNIKSPEQGGSYYENMKAISVWQIHKNMADYGKPVDKTRWGMPPQMVNAYFNPSYNEIVFPAAILQAPFYDYQADAAVNYGGIGAVIGHEISHGFDDSGARYNSEGNLIDWWTTTDLNQFTTLGKALASQYSALQPFNGIYVDGDFTLGENIGDLGGITAAYHGLKLHLANNPQENIDGFTPQQRFFISWATVWRTKAREEYIKNQVKTDPHAPQMYRAYVPLQNFDPWYEAFQVNPSNKLYIEPEKRVRIW